MITVKHVMNKGNEAIYSGTHVHWHRCAEEGDPQVTSLEVINGEILVASIRHSGGVYVMNDHGSTVAHYLLPPFKAQPISVEELKELGASSQAAA